MCLQKMMRAGTRNIFLLGLIDKTVVKGGWSIISQPNRVCMSNVCFPPSYPIVNYCFIYYIPKLGRHLVLNSSPLIQYLLVAVESIWQSRSPVFLEPSSELLFYVPGQSSLSCCMTLSLITCVLLFLFIIISIYSDTVFNWIFSIFQGPLLSVGKICTNFFTTSTSDIHQQYHIGCIIIIGTPLPQILDPSYISPTFETVPY